MAEPDLQDIHDFLFQLAIKAGEMITSANPSHVDTKKNSSDLVTETDKAVEDMVSSSLKSKYPDYHFLGEETAPPSGRVPNGPTFIVDPIDGTTNFVHAHPYISVSLCFAIDRRPMIGVVYNPFTQQLYHAIRGRGAYLTAPSLPTSHPPLPSSKASTEESNTKAVIAAYTTTRLPLRSPPPPLEGLDKALVAIEWDNERSGQNFLTKTTTFANLAGAPTSGKGKGKNPEPTDPNIPTLAHAPPSSVAKDPNIPNPTTSPSSSDPSSNLAKGKMVHSLRSLGSAALNCCAVARGDIDAYWEGGCWAWDVGAGWVIVEESGGKVVGANPGELLVEIDARRYLVVRAGTAAGGKGEGEQSKFIIDFWDAVGDAELTY